MPVCRLIAGSLGQPRATKVLNCVSGSMTNAVQAGTLTTISTTAMIAPASARSANAAESTGTRLNTAASPMMCLASPVTDMLKRLLRAKLHFDAHRLSAPSRTTG